MKIRTTKLPKYCEVKEGYDYIVTVKMMDHDIKRMVWYTYNFARTPAEAEEMAIVASIHSNVAIYKV